MKLSIREAWALRKRGLNLPTHSEYEDDRVKQIAIRQRKLMDEHDDLDRELKKLANPPQSPG
jgi:hypothetical protein